MFNDISPRYDLLNRIISFRRDVAWRKKAIKRLGIDKGDRVLDLACGTGDMILNIQKAQPDAEVIGGDFSIQMLIHGKKKVNVPLVAADACALPFESEQFDKITMVFGFRNVVDKPQALREMYRVLKKGGKFCILEFSQPKSKLFSKLYWFYFKSILPRVGRLVSRHESAYTYLPVSVEHFPQEEEYRQMITDAGFSNISFTPYDFGICTAAIAEKQA